VGLTRKLERSFIYLTARSAERVVFATSGWAAVKVGQSARYLASQSAGGKDDILKEIIWLTAYREVFLKRCRNMRGVCYRGVS